MTNKEEREHRERKWKRVGRGGRHDCAKDSHQRRLLRNATALAEPPSCDAPASQETGAKWAIFTAILPPPDPRSDYRGMHRSPSHLAAWLLPAVSQRCTNRAQQASNLNGTSAFVHGAQVCPRLLLELRGGEEQQVASALHKYLHIGKRADVRTGEICGLESVGLPPGCALRSAGRRQQNRLSSGSSHQLLVNARHLTVSTL